MRVQVYLNPSHLSKVDEIAKGVRVTRSQIIRDAVGAATRAYSEISVLSKIPSKPNLKTWLELAGAETSKTEDLGLRVDEIYHG